MVRRSSILVTIVFAALFFVPAPVAATDCMDCLQKQTLHSDPSGSWYSSDAVCCNKPCFSYEAYQTIDEDIGYGCGIQEVNNIVVVGTICHKTTDADQGCPPPSAPPAPPPDAQDGQSGFSTASPIVLDLGNDGYHLTSAPDGVQFDLRNEGMKIQTAWTRLGANNAFLARDLNGNGRIDSGAELFGNYTLLRSGQRAANGFEVLKELDSNHDGIIDARDAAWQVLVLWIDRNHDGSSTPDEIQPIASSDIVALEIDYEPIGRRDQWGNQFRFMSHARFRRGATEPRRAYYDVFFRTAQ